MSTFTIRGISIKQKVVGWINDFINTLIFFWYSLTHKSKNSVIRQLKAMWLCLAFITIFVTAIVYSPGEHTFLFSLSCGIGSMSFLSLFFWIRLDIFVPDKDSESKYNLEKKEAYPLFKLTINTICTIFLIDILHRMPGYISKVSSWF